MLNIRGWGQVLTSRFVEAFITPTLIHGVKIFDLRPGSQSLDPIQKAFEDLSQAKSEYVTAVRTSLRAVHISRSSSYALPAARIYATTLTGREQSDPTYLASRLVWAAEYTRLRRGRPGRLNTQEENSLRLAAIAKQVEFVESSDKSPSWLDGLKRQVR